MLKSLSQHFMHVQTVGDFIRGVKLSLVNSDKRIDLLNKMNTTFATSFPLYNPVLYWFKEDAKLKQCHSSRERIPVENSSKINFFL